VEPEIFLRTDICDGIEVVYSASVDRPGVADNADRTVASLTVGYDRLFEGLEVDGVVAFYRNLSKVRSPYPK
jgi:hypothetical protein